VRGAYLAAGSRALKLQNQVSKGVTVCHILNVQGDTVCASIVGNVPTLSWSASIVVSGRERGPCELVAGSVVDVSAAAVSGIFEDSVLDTAEAGAKLAGVAGEQSKDNVQISRSPGNGLVVFGGCATFVCSKVKHSYVVLTNHWYVNASFIVGCPSAITSGSTICLASSLSFEIA
jgi:hypothetical protein